MGQWGVVITAARDHCVWETTAYGRSLCGKYHCGGQWGMVITAVGDHSMGEFTAWGKSLCGAKGVVITAVRDHYLGKITVWSGSLCGGDITVWEVSLQGAVGQGGHSGGRPLRRGDHCVGRSGVVITAVGVYCVGEITVGGDQCVGRSGVVITVERHCDYTSVFSMFLNASTIKQERHDHGCR
jgi:hypothetical protein